MIPHVIRSTLDVIGPHERLPLHDEGLHDEPLAWVRLRVRDHASVRERLAAAGIRALTCRVGTRGFLLLRTPGGGRVEIDTPTVPDGDELTAFVEAFDRAIHTRRAGHSLACWQATNEAIAALVQLAWARAGKPPSPQGTLPPARRALPRPLRDVLRELRTGLNLRDTLADLRRVLAFADELSRWLGAAGEDLADELPGLRASLEADRFWNLRDVATWWAPCVRPGVLYRGRAPTVYAEEGFWDWADAAGVRRFVDLRGESERRSAPYPTHLAGCAVSPLDLSAPRLAGAGLDDAYGRVVARSGVALRAVLEAIAAGDGATMVHCHAGVDRTGVVVALLGVWLGVPRERIDADYRASGQLVEPRRLAGALAVAERHGVDRLLHDAGVAADTLARARERLLP